MKPASQREADGRAVMEMIRMDGWRVVQERINARVNEAVEQLRTIEVEGRNLADVGSECVALIKLIEGIRTVEAEVDGILSDYHQAITE